jgi:hypothetical protein
MANLHAILSYRIKDADGESVSMPIYFTVDDATTLADLNTVASALGDDLNGVIDGQITRVRVEVDLTVGGSWRAAPVSGAEIERLASFNHTLTNPVGKTYTQVVPTWAYDKFLGNNVVTGDTQTDAWKARMVEGTPPVFQDDVWGGDLDVLLSAKKTFRKHRKQTKRT